MSSHGLRLASCLALCWPLSVATDSDSLYILGSSESNDSERISTNQEIDKFLSMFLAPESTTSLVLTVYRPWSIYRTHQMKVARALNAHRRAEAPAIAVYVSQNWEPSNDLLREWLQRNVPDCTGKYSTLMVRVQRGRASRGSTNAGNAQSCQQALHCLLRTMYEEEEHDLPHGASDEDCAPTRQTVNDRPVEQNYGDNSVRIKFVILGTDGLWMFLKDQVAADRIKRAGKSNVQYAATALVHQSRSNWDAMQERLCDFIDDITAVVFWL
eukprot:s849_g9.t1